MVAEPRAPDVERGDEGVRVLEALQDRLRARAAGQRVGERAADPLQHGRAQEQVAHLRRLALQHLRQQIARHGALAAGELGHEALGVGVAGERDRGQPQAGGPAFGPLVEQRRARVGERDPARLQQLARLLRREAQIGAADLGQRARQPQPMQPEPRVLARRQHDAQRRTAARPGSSSSSRSASAERSSCRSSITSTTGSLERAQVGQQPLDDRLAAEGRRGADPLDRARLAGRAGELVDRPRARSAAHRARRARPTPRRPDRPAPRTRPRSAQHRLAAARPARTRAPTSPGPSGRQPVEQRAARHQPARGRQALRAGAAGHQCRLRGAPREGGAERQLVQIRGTSEPGSRVLRMASGDIIGPGRIT